MVSEIQEYLKDAVLPEKFQIFVEVETLFEELGISECQDKAMHLILSLADSGTNDLVDDLENLYNDYLERSLNLHGIVLNKDTDRDMEFLSRILKVLLSIPTSVLRYSILAKIDDSETDDLDLLHDIIELQDPEISAHVFFETVSDVSRSLLDRIAEIIEEGLDLVTADAMIVVPEAKLRYTNTPKARVDGPVQRFLLNGGSFSQDIKTLEIALADEIAELPSIEERATQCIISAIISSVEDHELEQAALYMAGGVVETYEDTVKINQEISRQLKDFGVNNGY
jgi:hypothetical protein